MENYQKRMFQYVGDHCETAIRPDLEGNTKPLVLVVQDESVFAAHDGKKLIWVQDGSNVLRTKGNGRCLMVSEFLCECHGRLVLDARQQEMHPLVPSEATVIIKPGKNADGWWTNDDLVNQIKSRVIPIFKILHPDCDGLFVFDNSQNHHAMAPDALVAERINLNDGGVNARMMRPGWFINEAGVEQQQLMQTQENKPKGLRTILKERNLWPAEGLKKCLAQKNWGNSPILQIRRSGLKRWSLLNLGSSLTFSQNFTVNLISLRCIGGHVSDIRGNTAIIHGKDCKKLLPIH
jgi:hypothetical protein